MKVLRGFTIIELVVVLAVLSVLALAVTPVAELTVRRAKERELKAALHEIRAALDAYKRAHEAGRVQGGPPSGYPASVEVLVDGVVDAKDARAGTIYFLRRVPRDPFAVPGTRVDQMWGLRSYASPPDRPRPGEDVFDVYSLAPGVGLNGIAYRDW